MRQLVEKSLKRLCDVDAKGSSMNARYVLLVLCLLLIALPASAVLINASVISNTLKSVSIGEEFGGSSYSYIAVQPSVIQELKVASQADDFPVTVILTLNDQTTITSTILTHRGFFTRAQNVSILGGSTSTETVLDFFFPVNRLFFAESNTTPKVYYFVIADLNKFVDLNNAYFDIDTNTDAMLTLPARPSSNPVVKVSISAPNGRFSGSLYTTTVDSLVKSENEPLSGGGGSYDFLALIGKIFGVIIGIADFVAKAASYVMSIGGLAIFVFSAQTFTTLVAAYVIITLILSIHDSDDLFKSIGKFFRYQMKLWRFFMEIFLWVKETIKWW